MIYHPTPEQIAACHALGESLLRFLLLSRPEPPAPEKEPQPMGPVLEAGRAAQLGLPSAPSGGAQPSEKLLVSAREAAAMLSICVRTLEMKTAPRGPIPAVRFVRAVRYSVEDLREWVRKSSK